eukprot:jgi/Botrbrau1/6073/Bobra.177_1s0012.1
MLLPDPSYVLVLTMCEKKLVVVFDCALFSLRQLAARCRARPCGGRDKW